MKNREELLTEILDDDDLYPEDENGAVYVAVDSTVYVVLEYIDELIEQHGHYVILGQVLKTLRNNVSQLGSKV